MWRILKLLLISAALLVATPFLALAVYDLTVFQPRMPEIRALLAKSEASEISPPESLLKVLRVAHPKGTGSRVAGLLLYKLDVYPNENVGTFRRQLASTVWSALLGMHMSEQECITLFLNLSYMGNQTTGFAKASEKIVGVPLDKVSIEQAARLMTVSKSPSAYLGSPERFNRFSESLATRAKNAL
ncbi:MAG: Penicillin-binding protein 1A [Betaproteobacteria bacterium ADurb.Bin341]|nr:MAG: Penicillin-binding protein 1A [Betaproteobacteria bacterium ADurb.Bin341]